MTALAISAPPLPPPPLADEPRINIGFDIERPFGASEDPSSDLSPKAGATGEAPEQGEGA